MFYYPILMHYLLCVVMMSEYSSYILVGIPYGDDVSYGSITTDYYCLDARYKYHKT